MMQAGGPAVAADPSALPPLAGATGAEGPPFAQPAVYDDWTGPASRAGFSFEPGQAAAVPAPGLPSGQAPLVLAQDVLRANGFTDAIPPPVRPNHS
jgi:hypothetical protein